MPQKDPESMIQSRCGLVCFALRNGFSQYIPMLCLYLQVFVMCFLMCLLHLPDLTFLVEKEYFCMTLGVCVPGSFEYYDD